MVECWPWIGPLYYYCVWKDVRLRKWEEVHQKTHHYHVTRTPSNCFIWTRSVLSLFHHRWEKPLWVSIPLRDCWKPSVIVRLNHFFTALATAKFLVLHHHTSHKFLVNIIPHILLLGTHIKHSGPQTKSKQKSKRRDDWRKGFSGRGGWDGWWK